MRVTCRRLAVLLPALYVVSAFAQTEPAHTRETIPPLKALAEQLKVALDRGDLDTADRLAGDLLLGIYRERKALEPTPERRLKQLEEASARTPSTLCDLARAAFDVGDLNKTEKYASELLLLLPQLTASSYGDAVFCGNTMTGRVALKRDKDMARAKRLLLASADTPGSPVLRTFGPNMSLARDLLIEGERDAVLEFFNLCRKFWQTQNSKLDTWAATVRGGGMPDFGNNLRR